MPEVIFKGPGPFPLPTPQGATASAVNENVEMRMDVLIDGETETLVIQMPSRIASNLVVAINRAVRTIESHWTSQMP
jgi:hypothetical protein